MIRAIVLALVLLLTLPALAQQSRVIIGGVDQRIPPLESQFLAEQLSEKARQLARVGAMMTLEQQDHKDAEERATATKAWLDQAWKEMEYWRAYSGSP